VIVSFKHKFIYIAILKTATHSFREALRPHLGPYDWEQCRLLVEKAFPVKPIAQIKHGHITCTQIQPFLLPGMWSEYFKFCTVRNPYERFVSLCYFYYKNSERWGQQNLLSAMKQTIEQKEHFLFRPQHEYITDESGQIVVDYICKFENLQYHFEQVSQRIGLPISSLSQINAFSHPPYQQVYDRELKDMVQTFYQKDFTLFDYSVDL